MPAFARPLAAALLLTAACTLAGAADPVPDAPAASASAAPEHPTIFMLFDIDMEVSAQQAGPAEVRQARELARRQSYDSITTHLKAWAERNGVSIDTALFSANRKVDMGGRRFSHLVVEKITQAAIETTAEGPTINTRKWSATAYDTSHPTPKGPAKLGTEDFISDASACFESPLKPTDEECRADYLRRLTRHLQWIDTRWGDIEPAAR
jgi:hypothetical protein